MAQERTDDYIPLDDPSPAPLAGGHSASEDSLSPVDLVKAAPVPHMQWARLWAIPVFSATYLIHRRFRRYSPRRLPLLTSVRPAELHAVAGLFFTGWTELLRLRTQALREDKDLCTIHVAAACFQVLSKSAVKKLEDVKDRFPEVHDPAFLQVTRPPPQANLWSKLVWKYRVAFHHGGALNIAMIWLVDEYEKRRYEFRSIKVDDLVFLGLFFTDDAASHWLARSDIASPINHVVRYIAAGFAAVTPLAMLARRIRRPYLYLPLNLVQRLLLYSTALADIALFHRHYYYPTTLRDRHALAEFLTKTMPSIKPMVDEVYSGKKDYPDL
ncbi:hypothetical protein OH77DRAFT_1427648 [Trametes cingulata]|nr:hypothetical protein OH77DRAFT_1427648 [Trametes cingulata]